MEETELLRVLKFFTLFQIFSLLLTTSLYAATPEALVQSMKENKKKAIHDVFADVAKWKTSSKGKAESEALKMTMLSRSNEPLQGCGVKTEKDKKCLVQSKKPTDVQHIDQPFDMDGNTEEGRFPEKDEVIVFISFSMPEASLKELFEKVQKHAKKIRVVIRGLINNDFPATIQKMRDLGGVVQIDPVLFKTYDVNVVPTFVRVKEHDSTPSYVKMTGNVSLEYALQKLDVEDVS
jgi:type-F conjugative transfer system pilin assembly protein TrbC